MTTTDNLLRVFRVDKQLRGLRSRLVGAERYLAEQVNQLDSLSTRNDAIEGQLRQMRASAADAEGESQRLETHMAELRERMNTAQTNKEYKALLAELNNYKEQKQARETEALELLGKVEELEKQRDELGGQLGQRQRVKDVAEQDRAQRAAEIKDKLQELEAQRAEVIAEVPEAAMRVYDELVARLEDEAMAPIEIQDQKRHEFTCGCCMMAVPVETMSSLLSHGELTTCVSCGCILYLDEAVREKMTAGSKR